MTKTFLALFLSASLLLGGTAMAQVEVDATVDIETRGQSEERRQDTATGTSDAEVRGNASSSARVDGKANAEAHRSSVATFVQSLLSVADRDTGIGAEVRAVAQSQQDIASSTAEAMAKVEGRSAVLEFLFGTDWKNLGAVRSAVARGEADIQRLEGALEKASSATVRAELEAQIDLLEKEQAELEAFVTAHEESFSLLGWFTKLFVQAEA